LIFEKWTKKMSKIEKLKKILGKKVGCYHKKKLASGAEKKL